MQLWIGYLQAADKPRAINQAPVARVDIPVRPKHISTWKKVISTSLLLCTTMKSGKNDGKKYFFIYFYANFMQIYNIFKNNNNKLYKHFLAISFKIMILHALYILMITNIYALLAFYLLLFELR